MVYMKLNQRYFKGASATKLNLCCVFSYAPELQLSSKALAL